MVEAYLFRSYQLFTLTTLYKMPDLEKIATQLESHNSKDRLLALTALREVAPEDAVPLIKKVLNDEILPVRSMAVFALGVKPTAECFPILINLLQSDPDYGIRADAAGALGYLNDIRAFEHLTRAFYEDDNWLVRFSAAVSLGNLQDIRAKKLLMEALDSKEVILQQAAIAALGEIKAVEAVEKILTFATSDDWLIRQRIAEALGKLDTVKSRSALKFLAKDSHSQVKEAAQLSLEGLESAEKSD